MCNVKRDLTSVFVGCCKNFKMTLKIDHVIHHKSICRWHETTSITIGHFNWQDHCIDSYLLYVAKLAILNN